MQRSSKLCFGRGELQGRILGGEAGKGSIEFRGNRTGRGGGGVLREVDFRFALLFVSLSDSAYGRIGGSELIS